MALTKVSAGVLNIDDLYGFRNRIINGAMEIDQRYSGSSNTKNAGSSDTYHLDRWLAANVSDAVYTVQQVEDGPTGFKNSLKITVTTADSSIGSGQINLIRQSIEGLNVADLAWGTANAKTITLSFWVKSSLTGQFGGSLTNSATNRSRTFSYTISSANTWEYKTVTISGDTTGTWLTTNGVGVRLDWNLGTGSTYLAASGTWNASNLVGVTGDTSIVSTLNATWQITGVQFEVGSVATPFERRPYGLELQLCQRYFYSGSTFPINLGHTRREGGNLAITYVKFPTTMRATPTGSTTGTWQYYSNSSVWTNAFGNTQQAGALDANHGSLEVSLGTNAEPTEGTGWYLRINGGTYSYSAEL
jgi:hypothetical protein